MTALFQKDCEGCGRRFEAQKASRKWCSDVCGRRARRQNAWAASPDVIRSVAGQFPVIVSDKPDTESDAWVRRNVAFARFVVPDLLVDLDFVDALTTAGDDDEATLSDWSCVARALVGRLAVKLGEFDSAVAADDDRVEGLMAEVDADMARLSGFLGDEFSCMVIARLADALRAS